ncbi:Replication protein A 70 kDa DNA-binding subunit B [Bienertia sinuspersici]
MDTVPCFIEIPKGTRVQATIFGRDIDSFANSLNILGHYYISNAMVKPIVEKHRIVNHPYQWIISTRTPVSEIPKSETKENLITTPFSLVPFYELKKIWTRYLLTIVSLTDIVAASIVSFPLKTLKSGTTFQEVLLIDQELKPKILTLWNEFASNEGEKISITLATRSSSTFLINIATLETNALQELLQNEEKKQIVINNSQAPSTTPMKDQNVVDVIQISTLLADDKNASSWWIKTSASITNYNKIFWYTGCNVCWRAIYKDHGQTFTCRNCSGQERLPFFIELVDPTGTITARIFGKSAEKIFEVYAHKLCINGNLSTTRQFYFQVKRSINKGNQYIVLKVFEKLQDENQEDASKTGPLKNEDEVEASTSISIQPNDGAKAPIVANT